MAEKCIELDSVEIAAAVLATVTGIFACWKKSFLLPLSAAAHSFAFPASLPMWRQRTAPWRECFF